MKFEIKSDFMLDGQPLKIISGAVHYFRITPDQWKMTLYNLRAMGCNTVETYVPWNLHEPSPGKYQFSGLADLDKFLTIAESLDLLIILRPAPYICAEWEYGGLPAWLQNIPNLKVRTNNQPFLQRLTSFYQRLFEVVSQHQITQNGRIIMMQVENEYGSYSNSQAYLRAVKNILIASGCEVPLFTSDGSETPFLQAGSLINDHILPTANFGSNAEVNFQNLKNFMQQHHQQFPLMCMEFWDGWFNRWGQPIIKRDPQEMGREVAQILHQGSINFYMFRGGTNFGFMNGCSEDDRINYPQVTSYDYDAILTEWGQPTAKFYELQKVIRQAVPQAHITAPLIPQLGKLVNAPIKRQVSLFNTLTSLTKPVVTETTCSMTELQQNYGYVLYLTRLNLPFEQSTSLRIEDGNDRCQIYLNQSLIATQRDQEIGQSISVKLPGNQTNELAVLVENQGRNNYGPTLASASQQKGIRSGILQDEHYLSTIQHYRLPLDNLGQLDFTNGSIAGSPTFYQADVEITKPCSTFLDCRQFGKGVVFVNGVNIGRYWSVGPIGYLYIPAYFWQQGMNQVTIFETEGVEISCLHFSDQPQYFTKEQGNESK